MMIITVGLDIYGQTSRSSVQPSGFLTFQLSFYWGTEAVGWGVGAGCKDNGAPVRCRLLAPANYS